MASNTSPRRRKDEQTTVAADSTTPANNTSDEQDPTAEPEQTTDSPEAEAEATPASTEPERPAASPRKSREASGQQSHGSRPSAKKTGGKGRSSASKRPTGKGGKGRGTGRGSRRSKKAVRAASRGGMAPTTIVLLVVAGLIAVGIISYGAWAAWDKSRPFGQQDAQQIAGVTNFRKQDPKGTKFLTANHVWGHVKYKMSPPVGGDHNPVWENCTGDVYSTQIPNEHAVHALEHGAVWIAYNPKELSKSQIAQLSAKVKGNDYMLMSPYPGLNSAISLQAWGFQLKVSNVNDGRIDKFVKAYRKNSNVEPGATCSGGIDKTGTEPLTQAEAQEQAKGMEKAGGGQ